MSRRPILASASARRLELLRGLGVEPVVRPAEVDETFLPGEAPRDAALRLARAKARAVAARPGDGDLVIAADTVVEVDGDALGKPVSRSDLEGMLGRLSGRVHRVHTAVAVVDLAAGTEASGVATSDVEFAALTRDEIEWYASTGDGFGKAGGYAVQGKASLFVRGIRGSHANVVGLPTELLYRLLLELGHDLKAAAELP